MSKSDASSETHDLGALRQAIDQLDDELLRLLNERARLAQSIGQIKHRDGRPIYAPERAEQLLRRLVKQNRGPLDEQALRAIYGEIMSASLALEKNIVIACEGKPVGRTHLAAKQQFGSSVRYAFHPLLADLFAAVASGEADCGVLRFSEEGLETRALELLHVGNVSICSQIVLGGDEQEKSTRYLVIGREQNPPSGDDQTALLLHLRDQPGALASALEPFRATGVNVGAISSRAATSGGLLLFLEADGHTDHEPMRRALASLREAGLEPKVCGSYPRARSHG